MCADDENDEQEGGERVLADVQAAPSLMVVGADDDGSHAPTTKGKQYHPISSAQFINSSTCGSATCCKQEYGTVTTISVTPFIIIIHWLAGASSIRCSSLDLIISILLLRLQEVHYCYCMTCLSL